MCKVFQSVPRIVRKWYGCNQLWGVITSVAICWWWRSLLLSGLSLVWQLLRKDGGGRGRVRKMGSGQVSRCSWGKITQKRIGTLITQTEGTWNTVTRVYNRRHTQDIISGKRSHTPDGRQMKQKYINITSGKAKQGPDPPNRKLHFAI